MKQHITTSITLVLLAVLLGACYPVPTASQASPPAPVASPAVAPATASTAATWQTFTNTEAGFSIMAPSAWSEQTLPDQNGGAIHGVAFTGPEGGVEVYWGVGFGGACPTGTEPVKLAQVEAQACHAASPDGTETWSQIGFEVSGGNSFSVRAYTGDAKQSSHELVLQVLATLTFMAPVQVEPAATSAAAETLVAAAARVPLKDALGTLEPQDVWQNFYDLTQIPRPSHHEEKVREFLVQFGQDLGLETIVDDVGNVLIRKPAAKGMETRQGVILQAHMDMVPQKTPESTHDFLTDPIEAYVEGEWVAADGTTLGADDGSGIAIAMAVLQSQMLPLGPIEALFTVNEEDGMDGASGLQPGVLLGDTLINLDSEEVGVFTIGSAGGEYLNLQTTYAEAPLPNAVTAYTMTVSGLQGGHSGVDINLGRGHATKLLVRLLDQVAAEQGVRVARLSGGTAANAIPREADALVVVPTAQTDAFLAAVQTFEATVQSELAATEPDLTVQATPIDLPATVMDESAQQTLIAALYGSPQGVLRMSDAVPDLVETSLNMGIVNAADGQLAVTWYSRSSVDSELVDVRRMLTSVWELAGMEVVFSGTYSGWNPNPESPIVLLMEDIYNEMYGQDPEVSAVHAGLECGTIVSKYPGMDADLDRTDPTGCAHAEREDGGRQRSEAV